MPDSPERVSIETQPPSQAVLEALQALIPGAVSDGVIDAQRIGEAAGLPVAGIKDGAERFGLMWAGKSKAVEALQAPSMAALAPDMKNSINWDTAENVFIEGDNLEVLKLLQKAYNDQVKLIYLDPPYNTGNDFVYKDDFSQPLKHYLEVTGQVDAEGNRLVANTEVSGRKHSNWLSMMYPRLVFARNVLKEDGLIFISIDDNEVVGLRRLLDEIFGEENFLGQLPTVMNLKGNNDEFGFAGVHEYTIVYARNLSKVKLGEFLVDEEGLEKWDEDDFGPFKVGANLKATGQNAPRSKRPNLFFPLYVSSDGKVSTSRVNNDDQEILPLTNDEEMSWRWSKDKFTNEPHNVIVSHSLTGLSIYKKQRPEIGDVPTRKPKSLLYHPSYSSGNGTQQIKALFNGETPFSHPKPLQLIQDFILLANDRNAIVMDFFAGSGTTAHAVYAQNSQDGGNRKFVLINIPEATDGNVSCERLEFKKVSDVTRARIMAVAKQREEWLERGLRSLALGPTSFIAQTSAGLQFELRAETISESSSDDSITAEVLLKNGVRLDQPWNRLQIAGESAVVSDGVCVVLARELNDEIVVAAKELQGAHAVIFLEDAFAGRDAVKANAVLSFKQANKIMKTV
ncbi:MAG: site-specific DNA-methyltransferase [Actinobacteria bacterium]|nr:site-specific DNA-methyltransferase [Actinomycetota bacterium]